MPSIDKLFMTADHVHCLDGFDKMRDVTKELISQHKIWECPWTDPKIHPIRQTFCLVAMVQKNFAMPRVVRKSPRPGVGSELVYIKPCLHPLSLNYPDGPLLIPREWPRMVGGVAGVEVDGERPVRMSHSITRAGQVTSSLTRGQWIANK
jgi:hypothetical protein